MPKAIENVTVEVSVVLGRANMPIHQLLKMGRGAVIELDTAVTDHALVFANDRLIAKGDVMIKDDHVAVNIAERVGQYDD